MNSGTGKNVGILLAPVSVEVSKVFGTVHWFSQFQSFGPSVKNFVFKIVINVIIFFRV